MVEFCGGCGTSLPKGDLTIREGKIFTSPDYHCPSCGDLANPNAETGAKPAAPAPEPDQDLVIRQGEARIEQP